MPARKTELGLAGALVLVSDVAIALLLWPHMAFAQDAAPTPAVASPAGDDAAVEPGVAGWPRRQIRFALSATPLQGTFVPLYDAHDHDSPSFTIGAEGDALLGPRSWLRWGLGLRYELGAGTLVEEWRTEHYVGLPFLIGFARTTPRHGQEAELLFGFGPSLALLEVGEANTSDGSGILRAYGLWHEWLISFLYPVRGNVDLIGGFAVRFVFADESNGDGDYSSTFVVHAAATFRLGLRWRGN